MGYSIRWFARAGGRRSLVAANCQEVIVQPLRDAGLWGRPISDERYLLIGRH